MLPMLPPLKPTRTVHPPHGCGPALRPGLRPALLLLLALAGGTGCAPRTPPDTVPGYLETQFFYLASPRAGYLAQLPVRRGETVPAGGLLFALDGATEQAQLDDLNARLASAEARLRDARKGERPENLAVLDAQISEAEATFHYAALEKERVEKLFAAEAVPGRDWDQARASFDRSRDHLRTLQNQRISAGLGQREDAIVALERERDALRSQVGLLAWQRDQTRRTAPVEILVHDTLYQPGEWVPAGQPAVVARPLDDLRVRFYVPVPRLPDFAPGGAVEVLIPGKPTPLPARINRVGTAAEYTPPVIYSRELSETLVFLVEAQLSPADARTFQPGLPVQVRLRP